MGSTDARQQPQRMGAVSCVSWGLPQVRVYDQMRATGDARVSQKSALGAYVGANALGASAERSCMQLQTGMCRRETTAGMLTGMLGNTDTPDSQGHMLAR